MMSKTLLNQGVDIILPVAGPGGLGTLELLKENGSGLMIGTDTDWSYFNPGLAEYILASVVKRMDIWVLDTIRQVFDGSFVGENSHGTLENGYVGLNYGSAWESRIPPELLAEIDKLVDELIASGFGTSP